MLLARRSFLLAASLAAAPIPAWARGLSRGAFTHGIASGDPLPDGVIIWTRFASSEEGRVGWEIADDENFTRVAQRGQAVARFANDFCVKADVRGLQPGRPYFYRFLSASGPSPTGRTRTAPQGSASSLSIAFFSCSNFPYGYFHAYGHAAEREDIDLALHLGDYMYEGHRGGYPSAAETAPGRILDPLGETVTIADYYQRYGCYHQDANLLELRRLKPMSVVWDDHDFANNAWRDGAQNHHPNTQGPWVDRVAAASKAYFDWMPIRRPDSGLRIYRSLDWGDLARILLIDTRFIGRTKQLDYRDQFLPQLAQAGANASMIAAAYRRDVLDEPARSMMGAAQEAWFAEAMAQSKSNGQPWQVIAQQILLGDQKASPALQSLMATDASASDHNWINTAVQTSALDLPWNLDNWSGYPVARARFIEACAANSNNALVLAGDSHNCWLNNIPATNSNRLAAIEFAGGSVTSPGFERDFTLAGTGDRERLMRAANPNLAWCDVTNRGYGAVKLTRAVCDAEWVAFSDIRPPQKPTPVITHLSSATSAGGGPGAWAT